MTTHNHNEPTASEPTTTSTQVELILSNGQRVTIKRPVRQADIDPTRTALLPNSETVTLSTPPNSTSKRKVKGGMAKQGRRQYNKRKAERRSYRKTVAPQRTATDQAGMPLVDGAVTLSFEAQRTLKSASEFDWSRYSSNQRTGKGI